MTYNPEDFEADWYEGQFLHETEKAILFQPDEWDEDDAVWLPKYKKDGEPLIDYEDIPYERYDPITVEIPNWLAKDKGLKEY